MGDRGSTLPDILSSQQFQTVILFALGLNTCQIADLLETGGGTICSALSDSFERMLGNAAGTRKLGTSMESSQLPYATWVM